MLKIFKHLKPFTGLILLAIILLFAQAVCDLALPDYMSKIVNTGIQQGGIESAVPKVITESKMEHILLFVSDEEKAVVLDNYSTVEVGSDNYQSYKEDYPNISEDIYVVSSLTKEQREELETIMSKGLLMAGGLEQAMASQGGEMEFNGQKLPEGTDLFAMMGQIPQAQRLEMVNSQVNTLGESMVKQSATLFTKMYYDEFGYDTGSIQSHYIFKMGLIMLLITLASAACTIMVGFIAARVAAGFARNLRKLVFEKVETFSNTELDQFSTASLITRSTNDITQVQMLMVFMVRMIFYAPIMGIGGVIRAYGKSPSMSWIIALSVITLLGIILVIFSIVLPKFKAMQKLVDRLNLVARENLSGMMVIRAFRTEKFEEDRFDKANTELTKTGLFVNRLMSVLFPAMTFIMNGVGVLIIWVASHQIAEAKMQVGDMMAFMQYAMQIIISFLMVSIMFIMVPRASVSANRIAEVLAVNPVINDLDSPKKWNGDVKGVIEFNNVSFRYPGAEEDMLKNISFKALPGQTTAIIGSTGSGKTTLVSLIPRFYDVTEGEIKIDSLDIRSVKIHDLRDAIGYVPQKGVLFSGTIESNLRYADENADDELIRSSAEIAQALSFIEEKPDGFDSEISQGGTNVSGGQKQRLSIARALVKRAPIYIFDDSFSALDFKTDANLRRALKDITKESTVLIVAQRISTIKNADQIIVLEEGKMVGIGKHQELMQNCETYREIALSQLSKEELA